MKNKIVICVLILVLFGLAPYGYSLFSYRSAIGMLGDGYQYMFIDKTHFDAFKIVYYHHSMSSRIHSSGGSLFLDGTAIVNDSRSVLVLKDGTRIAIPFDINDYITTHDFRGGIFGLFGPVPRFKSYEITAPDDSFKERIVAVAYESSH